MVSWVDIANGSGFSLDVLPYGIFSTRALDARIGVAIGEYVLDMKALAQDGAFRGIEFDQSTLEAAILNPFASTGQHVHQQVRKRLQDLLAQDSSLGRELRDDQDRRERLLIRRSEVKMHLPMSIGDYTDFFVGPHHAQNFVIDKTPTFGPCQKLDIEVEFAAFIGQGNTMGSSIHVDDAESHIFGFVLLNDWSARDIQVWESAPLGPFNGKNFATTISPWVVPLEALESYRELPLRMVTKRLGVHMRPGSNSLLFIDASGRYSMFECNTKNVAFSFAQMLAHHTAGGCPMRTGDLIATGTLSGTSRQTLGCLLEASRNGTDPFEMETEGLEKRRNNRRFLEDGDTVLFFAPGFGDCRGQVLPSA
ncbi:hypothetical protein N7528_009074 [Penicillium herquei]|nr:hypothetical protein N7528_009074 [Penicillium herquei]